MGKKVNLSAYTKPITKNKVKKGLVQAFLIGFLWFVVIILPWLFWLKPYKKFGYYYEQAVYNKNVFIIDAEHMKILYEIDGVEYEKTIWYHTTRYAMNEVKFCYQLDNPYYLIMGDSKSRNTMLIVFPFVASLGLLLCGYGIWWYKKNIKIIKEYETKENSNEKFIEKK